MEQASLSSKLKKYLAADSLLQQVYNYTKQRFNEATHLTAHNWEHIYRDTLNAIVIGEAEGADMSVVLPAIIMHDIGFLYGADGKTHGEVGAQRLPEYLSNAKIVYSDDDVKKIADCIRTHKGSMHGHSPETLKAQVVADADLLEKFGPFGVYQGIRTFTEFNYSLEKILERGELTASLTLQTNTAKQISEPGRQFVIHFFRQLKEANKKYDTYEN